MRTLALIFLAAFTGIMLIAGGLAVYYGIRAIDKVIETVKSLAFPQGW